MWVGGGGAAGKRRWKKDGEWGSWRDGREVHGGRDEGEGEGGFFQTERLLTQKRDPTGRKCTGKNKRRPPTKVQIPHARFFVRFR